MGEQPIASFWRLVGGATCTVDVLSPSADQREDARMGSAAAMLPRLVSRFLFFFSKMLGFLAMKPNLAFGDFERISIFL